MSRKRAHTPPYVPRKGLRAVLDQLQLHGAGDALTRDELHKRGVSAHLIYPAMAALRFLGLLGDDDRLTGRHTAFNREAPDRPAQEAAVREGYSDFFSVVELPVESVEVLRQKFQEVYELSDRVVNSAFPLFQFLGQEAGIDLTLQGSRAPIAEEDNLPTPRQVAALAEELPDTDRELLRMASAEGLGTEQGIRIRHAGYQIVLNLQVTKFTTEKDLIKMIKTAKRAIHLLKKAGDAQH